MEIRSLPVEEVRLGFIGAGRLAGTLARSLARRGCRVEAVASRSRASAERLAAGIEGCRALDPQAVVDACHIVFVATPDAAIAPTAESLHWRAGVAAVHCSGATEVSALAAAARAGAWTGGFHPLQSFADPDAAERSLPGCTITIEAEAPLYEQLVALAERLGCRVNHLPPGARARYHAAAGYASQFVNVLLAEAAAIWRSWGATEADAVEALLPLVRGTLASVGEAGVARGMPGPVSRGDVETIAKHVAALAALDPGILLRYRALCGRTVDLALEAGGIDEATAERIRVSLHGTPQR